LNGPSITAIAGRRFCQLNKSGRGLAAPDGSIGACSAPRDRGRLSKAEQKRFIAMMQRIVAASSVGEKAATAAD